MSYDDPAPALVPASTGLSVVLLLLYGAAAGVLYVLPRPGVPISGSGRRRDRRWESFAVGPWWAVVFAHILVSLFGFLAAASSPRLRASRAYFALVYAFLWDTGLALMPLALLRALTLALHAHSLPAIKLARRAWSSLLLCLLLSGYSLRGLSLYTAAHTAGPARYTAASRTLLAAALLALGATILVLAALTLYALAPPRRRTLSSATRAAVLALSPTLLLLILRLVTAAPRLWAARPSSTPVFVALDLVPDLLIAAAWLALAYLAARWDTWRAADEAAARAHRREVWGRHIDAAIAWARAAILTSPAPDKKGDMLSRTRTFDLDDDDEVDSRPTKPWLMFVAETRGWELRGQGWKGKGDAARAGDDATVEMLLRLRVLALVVADNLVLFDDPAGPLLRRTKRAIDLARTEARVADVLAAEFGLGPRAEGLAREWCTTFVADWRTLT
ncbi:hypothetical protein EJ06DRAFT_554195 [Trichodelitschia bisporula]|uniref:Uncharacterized protein n=1 Tax=Trichodelitschia bisporula TaxID=703511 RepID=A0A6G1I6T0_9PEZI|nr:hypothetical protein EJ06DRAFT_554195 [Trichodelitschia bisporula]